MSLRKIEKITGTAVHIPGDDIDTDRIIPAAYMKCVTFDGLGEHLFRDVRFEKDGTPKQHPLNDPKHKDATILISGNNFGCGSSREHAPQAIHRAGFQAVIAGGFAEIFFGNSTTLGVPCVSLNQNDLDELAKMIEQNPQTEITIDLQKKQVVADNKTFPLEIRESARESLINGKWDAITDLLANIPQVKELEAELF